MSDIIPKVLVENKTFDMYSLPQYTTPYYYCKELGSFKHYQTLRGLKSPIKQGIKKGIVKLK